MPLYSTKIVALALGALVTATPLYQASANPRTTMTEHEENPFTAALAIAVRQRAEMRSQRHELKPVVENLFAGQSTAAFADFLSQTLVRDKAFRPIKLNVAAIQNALENGEKIAIDFTSDQIRAITGEAGSFLKDDLVALAFSTEPTTGSVKIDAAAIVNTKTYP